MAEDDIIGDEEVAETVGERLIGLTEMFPDSLRNFSCNLVCGSVSMIKSSLFYLRQAAWIASATAIIGIMPYLIEKERFDYEEQIRQDERKVCLHAMLWLPSANVNDKSMQLSLVLRHNLRSDVLKLYKEIFRVAANWESANVGETEPEKKFIKGEARRLFHQNKMLEKDEDIKVKLKEGRARLEIGLHYKNPYPRPVYAPPQTLAGIDENKKKLYKEKLKRDGKPIYIDSIRDE